VQRRTRAPGAAAGPAPPAATARSLALDLGAIVVLWLAFAWAVTHGTPAIGYDTLRDMAYAQGILRGGLGHDPALPGLPAWYPPGNALLFAALSWLTRVSVVTLYATSPYWLGWLAPAALYLLVRAGWGRATAWLALPTTLLGSTWWLVHAAVPMPSVQTVGLGLLALLAWTRAREGGLAWAAACGLLGALAFWSHPICGAVVLGAIAVHGALAAWPAPGTARGPATAGRAAIAVGIGALLSAPLVVQQLALPRRNAAPHHWFAPELHDARFALHAHAPLVLLLGLAGLAWSLRERRRSGWLVGYFAAALAGELAGYLGHDLGWRVPWALPHEFQWHEQLALAIAAAVGVARCSAWVAARARRARGAIAAWTGAGLALLALGPAIPDLRIADTYLIRLDPHWSSTLATADWVRRATPPGSVFACPPEDGYYLSGLTGRACIALPAGHMNPAADLEARTADLATLLTTRDESEFLALARRYGADYLLVEPGSPGAREALGAYAGWRCLERMPVPAGAVPVFRVRRERGS
jgi:hypothetical protein